MKFHSVEDRPLFIDTPQGWVCTEDGEGEFMAAVPYNDARRPGEDLWWIRHCLINEDGLCVVCDDEVEVAGWNLDQVTHWCPVPKSPL